MPYFFLPLIGFVAAWKRHLQFVVLYFILTVFVFIFVLLGSFVSTDPNGHPNSQHFPDITTAPLRIQIQLVDEMFHIVSMLYSAYYAFKYRQQAAVRPAG